MQQSSLQIIIYISTNIICIFIVFIFVIFWNIFNFIYYYIVNVPFSVFVTTNTSSIFPVLLFTYTKKSLSFIFPLTSQQNISVLNSVGIIASLSASISISLFIFSFAFSLFIIPFLSIFLFSWLFKYPVVSIPNIYPLSNATFTFIKSG